MQTTLTEYNHIRTTQSLLLFFEQIEPEKELPSEFDDRGLGSILAIIASPAVLAEEVDPLAGAKGGFELWASSASYAMAWLAKNAALLGGRILAGAAGGMWEGSGASAAMRELENYLKRKADGLDAWMKKKKEEWGTPEDTETRGQAPEEVACKGRGDLVGNIVSCRHGTKINPSTCKCEAVGAAGHWHMLRRWFKDLVNNLRTLIQTLWTKAKETYRVIAAVVASGTAAAWDWLKENAPKAWEWLKGAGDKGAELAKEGIKSLRDGLVKIWGWIKDIVSAIAKYFKSDDSPDDATGTKVPDIPTPKKATPEEAGTCQPGYVKAAQLGISTPIVRAMTKDKCIKCDHKDVISKVRLLIRAARNAKRTPDRSDEDFFGKDLSPEERISQDDLICLGSLTRSGFGANTTFRLYKKMAEELPVDAYNKSGVAAVMRANSTVGRHRNLLGDIFKNSEWYQINNLHSSWREWLKENKKKKTDKVIYENKKLPVIRKRYEIINELTMKKLAGV